MTQLYVGNLSADGDEKAIRALFSKYGNVREVLMKNGYSFVEFEHPNSADEAMRALNGERRFVFFSSQPPSPYIRLASTSDADLCVASHCAHRLYLQMGKISELGLCLLERLVMYT